MPPLTGAGLRDFPRLPLAAAQPPLHRVFSTAPRHPPTPPLPPPIVFFRSKQNKVNRVRQPTTVGDIVHTALQERTPSSRINTCALRCTQRKPRRRAPTPSLSPAPPLVHLYRTPP